MPSKKVNPIEVANLKSIGDFITEYLPPGEQWKTWIHPRTKEEYEVSLQTAKALSEPDFEACFHLIEFTSSTDYKNSKDGWKPRSKRKEMKLLDLKYLLVKRDSNVEGFVSLMPTYEDGYPVMYCYEIHLSPALQGTGLGTALMNLVGEIAARIPGTEKVMLTCFTSNVRGVKFYERLGYAKDEFSPPPKVLRNGTKVEAEYVILSKDRR
ncbi:acyl-CoA N-acyltransferase [Hyaloscypha sp. PMI_1271]|nr:acyl-CoA N-acyltransferase [Hyaloscypha sp. PMI_1271]